MDKYKKREWIRGVQIILVLAGIWILAVAFLVGLFLLVLHFSCG